MNISIYNRTPARPVRLLICAALAFAITGVTTQVIVSSVNHLEYSVAASDLAVAVQADATRHNIVVSAS